LTRDKELNPMNVLKPIKLGPNELDETQPFTSSELGKLWATSSRVVIGIQLKKILRNG
jgi:hypothetical protein